MFNHLELITLKNLDQTVSTAGDAEINEDTISTDGTVFCHYSI